MTTDDWIEDYRLQAYRAGDRQRQQLCTLHHHGWEHREIDPGHALSIYEEGSRLAQALREPWWQLYYDNWRVNTLIFWLQDYHRGLDLAVANSLEVRKPIFAQFPGRFSTYFNLVDAYIGVDPAGYRPLVEDALEYLQREIPAEGQPIYRLLKSWCSFALSMDWWDAAEQRALAILRQADNDANRYSATFHSTFALGQLCLVAWQRRHRPALEEWVHLGKQVAEQSRSQSAQGEFQLWEAVLTRWSGETTMSKRLCGAAVARIRRLRTPPGRLYFDALAGYHELNDDLNRSLRIRLHEQGTLQNTGMLAAQCRNRMEVCRLLARLNQPLRTAVEETRALVRQLRHPEPYLSELERLFSEHERQSAEDGHHDD